jgi:hypothetical protein
VFLFWFFISLSHRMILTKIPRQSKSFKTLKVPRNWAGVPKKNWGKKCQVTKKEASHKWGRGCLLNWNGLHCATEPATLTNHVKNQKMKVKNGGKVRKPKGRQKVSWLVNKIWVKLGQMHLTSQLHGPGRKFVVISLSVVLFKQNEPWIYLKN